MQSGPRTEALSLQPSLLDHKLLSNCQPSAQFQDLEASVISSKSRIEAVKVSTLHGGSQLEIACHLDPPKLNGKTTLSDPCTLFIKPCRNAQKKKLGSPTSSHKLHKLFSPQVLHNSTSSPEGRPRHRRIRITRMKPKFPP